MTAGEFHVLRRRRLKRLCELAADEINGALVFSGLRSDGGTKPVSGTSGRVSCLNTAAEPVLLMNGHKCNVAPVARWPLERPLGARRQQEL